MTTDHLHRLTTAGGSTARRAWAAPLLPGLAQPLVGVLGGMGPLASAEFLKSIYEQGIEGREQEAPAVIVYSDPSFPDRTEALLAGQENLLLDRLDAALAQLDRLGATAFVLCCMTLHHLLPRLRPNLRERVVSLLDTLLEQMETVDARLLLVCSSGSRKLRMFEQHPRWSAVRDRVVLPDERDQELIHRDIIYRVKCNAPLTDSCALLAAVIARYGAAGFMAGCSEVHLLAKHHAALVPDGVIRIDPLAAIAREIRTQYAVWRASAERPTPVLAARLA